ncbi:BolA/IbaG family iron-sulfur metabolism protein [Mannheimia sp. AT1]|uniref:BolA/IbaG family iron-sulfur metabolism protein n=1 Tax=Mannheimia cairinae TaxID=3025936 RepID=A0ABT5MN87_9PAST|nr:BolA/IbaG family iron-sulfur metabolism protein [Mannheimia cairinae]MDD0823634.1 BolA/IbaG family iron-sulfur metabolism protein [Mannheimia cairinae]MDD0825434.1 BolA/IbaG family iron-sulfur metabolism protein [Mannheimia cairinae]
MSVEQTIIEKINAEFSPLVLNIENESYMHSSGRGSESHFKLTLVSKKFEGQRTVARHRAVYTCLADELANGVHALALHLYTESEWEEISGTVPKSPNCLGVGQ